MNICHTTLFSISMQPNVDRPLKVNSGRSNRPDLKFKGLHRLKKYRDSNFRVCQFLCSKA